MEGTRVTDRETHSTVLRQVTSAFLIYPCGEARGHRPELFIDQAVRSSQGGDVEEQVRDKYNTTI